MYEKLLENLNDEQRAAVLAKDGPILINAGAGSGKTRVLTSRIAMHLLDGVAPWEILALTFTKKAAGEMRERIEKLAGPQAKKLVMGTFHSVFIRFLREYHDYITFPSNFTIFDKEDADNCLKDIIGETLYGPQWKDKAYVKSLSDEQKKARKRMLEKVYKIKDVSSRISLLKNAFIVPSDYRSDSELVSYDIHLGRDRMPEIYEAYMKRCKRSNAMDFDDILVYTFFLFKNYPDIARQVSSRFRYVLVDEYQDTNVIQYKILTMLTAVHGNVCVVGDDSQSIYAFRGAKIENILNFQKDHPGCRQFRLEMNYRSTPFIVDAANALIENNEGRLDKHCYASRSGGNEVEIQFVKNDRLEARFIADRMNAAHDKGQGWNTMAVLYRTNAQARELEDALLKKHIPYVIYSGMSFFERMEIKDVLAYMKLVINHNDDESFKRICNKPARGISDETLNTLLARTSFTGLSLFEQAKDLDHDECGLKPKPIAALKTFVSLIEQLDTANAGNNAFETATDIINKTGIYALYKDDEDTDGQKRSNNIDELMNGISYFLDEQQQDYSSGEGGVPKTSLGDYLENIALLSAVDRQENDGDSVSLMTSHSAKGLEYDTVFIAGAEEGLYPALRNDSTPFDLEEERRLFYVSMTRARNELIITSCENRWKYGKTEPSDPSRFLDEIIPEDMPE